MKTNNNKKYTLNELTQSNCELELECKWLFVFFFSKEEKLCQSIKKLIKLKV